MKITSSLSILLGSVVLLAACSSTPIATVSPAPTPSAPITPIAQNNPARPTPAVESKVQPVAIPPYLDPRSALSTNRSIWFDYDVFGIKPEFNQMLQLHGKYWLQIQNFPFVLKETPTKEAVQSTTLH